MYKRDAAAVRRATESVVIVAEVGGSDYCSGFIIPSKQESTYVITQSKFVEGREGSLKVRFSDGVESNAAVLEIRESYCLLRTAFNPNSRPIVFVEHDITLSPIFVVAPASQEELFEIPCFITLESTSTDSFYHESHIANSEKHLMMTCHYGQSCNNGCSRLIASPVFTVSEWSSLRGDCG